ncbi:MAG: LysM peptidoglycan-binding domain-containing protein [Firmicutes bacterium]|nr:LysM peptidoglycan-binding domain-containing protein [Bacillota bacterium]
MFIYTARTGDTLDTVAQAFGVSAATLQTLNETPGTTLTPGVNLMVPGAPSTLIHHTVGAGETLTTIARKYKVPVIAVAGANGLEVTDYLEIGQILFVPAPIATKYTAEVNGYMIPSGTSGDSEILQESEPMTFATIFSYHVKQDGSLVAMQDQQALSSMTALGVAPLLCVTNFDGSNFNSDLAHTILAAASLRQKVIAAAKATMANKGFKGVNIDFEHMHPTDRPLYNAFIRELQEAMHQDGYSVSIAMGPKTSDDPSAAWMGAFDYKTLGSLVDFVMLMTYEWGWVGGPPMAPMNYLRTKGVL